MRALCSAKRELASGAHANSGWDMPKPSHILTLPTLHPHAAELRDAILNKLTYSCSKTPSNAGPYDWYLATVLAVRDRMVDRWPSRSIAPSASTASASTTSRSNI